MWYTTEKTQTIRHSIHSFSCYQIYNYAHEHCCWLTFVIEFNWMEQINSLNVSYVLFFSLPFTWISSWLTKHSRKKYSNWFRKLALPTKSSIELDSVNVLHLLKSTHIHESNTKFHLQFYVSYHVCAMLFLLLLLFFHCFTCFNLVQGNLLIVCVCVCVFLDKT